MGAAFLGPPSSTASHFWEPNSAHPRRRSIWTARVGGLNQGFNFPNLCSHDPTDRFSLARIEPVLEIAVAVALEDRPSLWPRRASGTAPISYRRLPAGVTGAGLCPTSGSFGHIRQPPLYVRLTHGVVCHFWSPPSRFSRIDDSDHPLGPRVDVEVPDLHRLLVAPPMPVEGLDQIELKPAEACWRRGRRY